MANTLKEYVNEAIVTKYSHTQVTVFEGTIASFN